MLYSDDILFVKGLVIDNVSREPFFKLEPAVLTFQRSSAIIKLTILSANLNKKVIAPKSDICYAIFYLFQALDGAIFEVFKLLNLRRFVCNFFLPNHTFLRRHLSRKCVTQQRASESTSQTSTSKQKPPSSLRNIIPKGFVCCRKTVVSHLGWKQFFCLLFNSLFSVIPKITCCHCNQHMNEKKDQTDIKREMKSLHLK